MPEFNFDKSASVFCIAFLISWFFSRSFSISSNAKTTNAYAFLMVSLSIVW
ncbi:hypothetical protein CPter291_3066 [Collimonas pratensis]|uniref:Uncharacterized protein n=1 Tax=Collimonas pratensis TaxID=279113 RepID=A0ABM5Z855_9BURK|nr:hypothetical protein CPter291_3066 [Collimonas pratensis]